MQSAGAWFALAVTGVGWFYIFASHSARRLGALEEQPANRRRVALRRINGMCLIALATSMFAGMYSIDPHVRPWPFLIDWAVVMLLLALSIVLALADVRLTMRLRRNVPSSGNQGVSKYH